MNETISRLKRLKRVTLKSEGELRPLRLLLDQYLRNISLMRNNEENLKGDLKELLSRRVNRYINIKENDIDLAIYSTQEKSKKMEVQVLIETKMPNSQEMICPDNFNKKALHEAARYYLNERYNGNRNIEKIIITDFNNFYIIPGEQFDQKFARNRTVKSIFETHINPKGDKSTGIANWFYTELEKTIEQDPSKFQFESIVSFNILDLINGAAEFTPFSNDERLNVLDNIFSPEFLLGESEEIQNANRLNANFYNELLGLIGVEEVEKDGKRIIQMDDDQPNSLIKYIHKQLADCGDVAVAESQLFDHSLGVAITWFNRLIFLKLFESYLLKINNPSREEEFPYRIFTPQKISDFRDLETLFFEVLSKPDSKVREFEKIPYLNSSLFERTRDENFVHISSVPNFDYNGKPYISQLLDFLNRYDYSAEGGKKSEQLINSSVLGLIFEKINGYKEGSYYTPSQITEFIARETIQRRALDKINDFIGKKGYKKQDSIEDLRDMLVKKADDSPLLKAVSEVIDSLKIIDPAVGSGHFLVSALNELLILKSQLGLIYLDGKYQPLKVKYDEYREIRFYMQTEEDLVYQRTNGHFSNADIWGGIFRLKQQIIEKQLFGVDINPNSVLICRLRLWVELLKNAYYSDEKNQRFEALPNLDINIKTGDSLLSQIEFGSQNKKIYHISDQMKDYRKLVREYYTAPNKKAKQQLDKQIVDIKRRVKTSFIIEKIAEKKRKLKKIEDDEKQSRLETSYVTRVPKAEKNKIFDQITRLEQQRETGDNTFEWAIEFPEALDDEGNYVGFDIVIMNPPYMDPKQIKKSGMYSDPQIQLLNQHYVSDNRKAVQFGDMYALFVLRSFEILAADGLLGLITSDTFLTIGRFEWFRERLLKSQIDIWAPLSSDVFKNLGGGPSVLTSIFIVRNHEKHGLTLVCNRFRKFTETNLNTANFLQIDADLFKQSIRSSFFTQTKSNIEIFKKIINVYKNDPSFRLLGGDGGLVSGEQGMATGNNSENLAVLDIPENKEYTEIAKQFIAKYSNRLNEESKSGRLHGKIWRIITRDKIRQDSELNSDEKANGIIGEKCWVHYVKGDDKGNRWWANSPYYINWSKNNVLALKNSDKARWQGVSLFFKPGLCWNLTSGDKLQADTKFRIFEQGVHDINAMKIIGPIWLLGYLNTKLISEIKYNFLNSTIANQLDDIKSLPIKLPSKEDQEYIEQRVKILTQMKKAGLVSAKLEKQNVSIDELETELENKICDIYGVDSSVFE